MRPPKMNPYSQRYTPTSWTTLCQNSHFIEAILRHRYRQAESIALSLNIYPSPQANEIAYRALCTSLDLLSLHDNSLRSTFTRWYQDPVTRFNPISRLTYYFEAAPEHRQTRNGDTKTAHYGRAYRTYHREAARNTGGRAPRNLLNFTHKPINRILDRILKIAPKIIS